MSFTRPLGVTAFAVVAGLALTVATTPAQPPEKESKMSERKQQVVDLLKSIETGDPKPAAVINPKKYVQHNLAVGDGIEGFVAVLKKLPKDSAKVKTVRVFEDGDFVFAHTEYDFFGPKIGFDVFRFEDGKIVEHWDNLQETPKEKNPSKRTMTDGPTEVTDADKTEANKKLVRGFVDDVLVGGKLDKLAGYFDGDNYIQHNPQIGDGLTALGKALEAMAKKGMAIKYEKVHKVLGEGNFVLVMSEGKLGEKHVAYYDLFRVEKGKIAEHWDTIEAIPDEKDWKNRNGKFGDDADVKEIKSLIEKYAKSIDDADTDLAAKVWADSPNVSFIHPRGHEKGWKQIKENFYEKTMGQTFSKRELKVKDVDVSVYGDCAVAVFYWDFVATLRKGESALKTRGRETQVFRKAKDGWSLLHVHYSGMPVKGEREGF